MAPRDPYEVLGIGRNANDEQIRTAYRHLVQLHHPDHNAGSVESARRFEEIQEAYARITQLRRGAPKVHEPQPQTPPDPEVDSQLEDLERQVREAHQARERARRAAQEAAAQTEQRPSDEELGYVTTEDTFSKVLADARSELAARFGEERNKPATERVADLLDEVAAMLRGDSRKKR